MGTEGRTLYNHCVEGQGGTGAMCAKYCAIKAACHIAVATPHPLPPTTNTPRPFPQLAIKNSVGLLMVVVVGGEGRVGLGAKKCCRGVFTTADV